MARTWIHRLTEALEHSLVFSALAPEDRRELVRAAQRVTLRDGALLHAWGEAGDGVAVLLEGALDVRRTFDDGTTTVYRRLHSGEAVGFSTLAGEPHTADLAAAGKTVVAVIPRDGLRRLIVRRPELALAIIGHLGHLVGLLSDEKTTWRRGSVEQRLCAWLGQNTTDGDVLEITHAELGRHVGATRANVTRALALLAQAGVVRRGRGRIEVLALLPCRGAPLRT